MKAIYHNGDVILIMSTKDLTTLEHGWAETMERAESSVIYHNSMMKATEKQEKRGWRNAKARAETRCRRVKKFGADLLAARKKMFLHER